MPQGLLVQPQHLLLVRQVGRHVSPTLGADGKDGRGLRMRRAATTAMRRTKLVGEGAAGRGVRRGGSGLRVGVAVLRGGSGRLAGAVSAVPLGRRGAL